MNLFREYRIECIDKLPKELAQKVRKGHEADEASSGIAGHYKEFSLVAANIIGETTGVLSAYTVYAEIYVDDIWVDPNHRKQGVGRRLLQELEERFRGKGYNNINLVTSQFQAVGFYERCGFQKEFVRTNKLHPELSKTFFVKYFDGER